MWPWEHVMVGYLAYSLFCHAWYRSPPDPLGTIIVVFASVLSDLVDKPLAWSLEVVETGYAIGHSYLFIVPLALVVGGVAFAANRARVGIAFGTGLLLHPPADIFYRYATGGGVHLEILLWPVVPFETTAQTEGVLRETIVRLGRYRMDLAAGDLSPYVRVQLALVSLTFLLWLYDGAPVLRETVSACRTALNS